MKNAAIELRTAVSKPLYGQVREMLLGRIGRGEWGPGDTLPNEFVLANQFDVSVGTIRRAIEGLEHSGIVVRKQGRGTYVSGQGAQALENKFTLLRSPLGRPLRLTYKLVAVARRMATQSERVSLGLDRPSEVLEIKQEVLSASRRIGVECSVLPAALFPRLESALVKGQHLYPLLSDHSVLLTRTEELIRALPATADQAESLGIGLDQLVLVIERLGYALDARPVEARVGHYLASEVSCGASA